MLQQKLQRGQRHKNNIVYRQNIKDDKKKTDFRDFPKEETLKSVFLYDFALVNQSAFL